MSPRSRPPLTVVITSYNRERYLGPSIESALASTFEDFEILVLDDASSDRSTEIALSHAERDPRIRLVVNERNLGDYGNRNRAIELVETPYLKFHDSDDILYRHCLEIMMRLLEAEPDAGFALTSGRAWPGGPCPMLLTPRMAYAHEYLGGGLFHCGPSGALFRTEVLREMGGFPERGVASDYLFWLAACAKVNVLLVPADLFWYRTHPGQTIQGDAAAREYALAQGESWRALVSSECPLTGEVLARARRSATRRLLKLTWRDARHGRWSHIVARLRSSGIRLSDWLRYPPLKVREGQTLIPGCENGEPALPEWVRTKPGRETFSRNDTP